MAILTPEQFFKGGNPNKARVVSPPTQPQQGNSALSQIGDAFSGGLSKIGAGLEQARPSQSGVGGLTMGIGKIVGGAAEAITSPLAPLGNLVGKGIDYATQPIQNNPTVQKFAGSPAGEDTIKTVETVADYNNALGVIAGGAAGRKLINKPKGPPGGSATPNPLISATGRALKGIGEKSYGLTVVPEESTKIAMQSYQARQPSLFSRVKNMVSGETEGRPTTEANTAARKGLVGTEWELGVQAKQVAGKLWTETIAPKLQSVKGKVNMRDFFSQVEKEIRSGTKELSRRNALIEGLDALKEDFKNVGSISLEKLQEYKEGWAQNLPESVYKGKPIGAVLKEVKNVATKKARELIHHYVGREGRQAYIDYGNLKSIERAGVKSIKDPATRSFGKNVWEAIMNKAITPIVTLGGKVLYRTGEGLEFMGNKGAKTVKDVINVPVQELNPKSSPTKVKINKEGKDIKY